MNYEKAVKPIEFKTPGETIKNAKNNNGWIPVKTRPLTDEEKEYYSEQYDFPDIEDMYIYDCKLPEHGQDVLITTCCDTVTLTTFYTDEGCYFESYEEANDVKAWMPLPEPYQE